jgi:rSAM/selenodomain-associated transferase 2
MSERIRLAVVIPTLNAAGSLPGTLAALRPARGLLDLDILVSDGCSTDATPVAATAHGARLVSGPAGRGIQLRRGAEAARGNWMLFLHADTVPAAGWAEAVRDFILRHGEGVAGYGTFRLDHDTPAARRVERLVAWRNRVLALPYGDQGLLVSKRLYDAVDGFRPLPLMEDVDLVRRLGRRRLAPLGVVMQTSAARYRRDGYWLRPLRNLTCLTLHFAGLPAPLLARLYR